MDDSQLKSKVFPPAPSGRCGWPWTVESDSLPPVMPDGRPWPKISIVTPSYNQGQFLEETIRSVLLQGYPNLEYIIMDGGSTDNSVEIIKKYECWVTSWVSEEDNGQTHALNKGFRKATGELVGWQNSDDYYGKDAFKAVAIAWLQNPEADVFHGRSFIFIPGENKLAEVFTDKFSMENGLNSFPVFEFFNQSIFFNRKIFDNGMFLNEKFNNAMDCEFLVRLILAGCKFQSVSGVSGTFRVHDAGKTRNKLDTSLREANRICIDLLNSTRTPKCFRSAALRGLKKNVIGCFRNLCLDDFRLGFYEVIRHGGIKLIDIKFVARYFFSFFGKSILARVLGRK